jgi:hypothetical protein
MDDLESAFSNGRVALAAHLFNVNHLKLGFAAKSFSRGQGVGCGVGGFIDFQVVNYLIFREKVPEFSPRSP